MSAAAPNASRPPAVRELFDLSGQAVLVTGAGSGIGRAIAARFAEAGARVAVHHHTSRDGAHAVVEAIRSAGGHARAFEADLTRTGEPERLVEGVAAAFGRLDALVNNAGSYPLAGLLAMSGEDWDAVLAANLKSALACLQSA
jgi:glucose 1-dehydrogenase